MAEYSIWLWGIATRTSGHGMGMKPMPTYDLDCAMDYIVPTYFSMLMGPELG